MGHYFQGEKTYGPKFPYKIHGITKDAKGQIGEAPDQKTAIETAQQWLRNNPTSALEAIILYKGNVSAFVYNDNLK